MSTRIAWLLVTALAAFLPGQTPPEFEVASVRSNTANDRIVTVAVGPGGRFSARGYTLVLLIQRAYGVMDWNVTGGPAWIRSDRFDIAAKANVPGDLTEAQLQPRLQALLAERFKLKLHKSSKEMSGYALVIGKEGPKLQTAADGQEHPDTFRMNQTGLSGQGIRMEDFARFVGGKLGLVAADQTGLKGLYDFKVDWKVEPEPSSPDFREEWRFVVLTALQNQLGLKLIPKKILIPMLVIDSAERASASEN